MWKLSLALLFVPAVVFADDFEAWKVPEGITTNPKKCSRDKDATECLHLAWDAEAGGRGIDETNHDRLVNAQGWFASACEIAKKKSCPSADRVKAKLAKVDAMKSDQDKARFYCGDSIDSTKFRVAGSGTAISVVFRDCLDLLPEAFRDGIGGMGKLTSAKKQVQVLQSALDNICPTLATKPAACSVKPAGLTTAKQREASAAILGAGLGGELATRGNELDGFLVAK